MPKNRMTPVSVPGPLLERAEHWLRRPMLLFLLAAFPAVLAATSFYDAFLLSVITLLLTVTTQTLLSLAGGRLAQWARILVAALVSTAVMTGLFFLASIWATDFFERSLFVLPMLALQPMVLPMSDPKAFSLPPKTAVCDALVRSAAFAAVTLVCGLLREFLAAGTLFGAPLFGEGASLFPAFAGPFGGFALLGIEAAAVQGVLQHLRHKKAEGGQDK